MPGVKQAQDTLAQTMYRSAPLNNQWFLNLLRKIESITVEQNTPFRSRIHSLDNQKKYSYLSKTMGFRFLK